MLLAIHAIVLLIAPCHAYKHFGLIPLYPVAFSPLLTASTVANALSFSLVAVSALESIVELPYWFTSNSSFD